MVKSDLAVIRSSQPRFERSLCRALLQPIRAGSTQTKPCHPLGMSCAADQLPGSAPNGTERGKARRFLLGFPVFCLGMTLLVMSELVHVAGFLRLPIAILPVALIISSLRLDRSRPQGMGRGLTPRTLSRIAHVAEVPELGTVIMAYGCLIVALSIPILNLMALYQTP